MSNKLTGDAGQTDIPSVLWQNKRNGGRGITELFDTMENKWASHQGVPYTSTTLFSTHRSLVRKPRFPFYNKEKCKKVEHTRVKNILGVGTGAPRHP